MPKNLDSTPMNMDDQGQSLILAVEGMTCASCAARIERKLKAVPGVTNAAVNFPAQKAYIQTDAAPDLGALEEAIKRPAIPPSPILLNPRFPSCTLRSNASWAGGWFWADFSSSISSWNTSS